MKNILAMIALSCHLCLLGFKCHNSKRDARFDRPANISEFDYRVMSANQRMIRGSMLMHEGMSTPFVKQMTDDHQRLVVRVDVSEEDLPSGFDERKKALLLKAMMAVRGVSEFARLIKQLGELDAHRQMSQYLPQVKRRVLQGW